MVNRIYFPQTHFKSNTELFHDVTAYLLAQGYVREGFEDAIGERERLYPTGLPIEPPVAIPHTDGEYVNRDAIVCIRNSEPLEFHEMGGSPDAILYPKIVIMLVMQSGEAHLEELQRLVDNIQDGKPIERLLCARGDSAFRHAVDECLA